MVAQQKQCLGMHNAEVKARTDALAYWLYQAGAQTLELSLSHDPSRNPFLLLSRFH